MSGQEIAAIASSGVMGLATVFLLILLSREKRAPGAHILASVVVIVLGAVVQLTTQYFQSSATFRARVRIELTPTADQFSLYLPAKIGEPFKARPRVWLGSSDNTCSPNAPPPASATEHDCPDFSKELQLANGNDTIYVSVHDAMREMRDRIQRLEATAHALSPPIGEGP